jgi:alpha-galactosidase
MLTTTTNLATWILFSGLSLWANQQPAKILAQTPPMGWNSWDAYGTTVTENEVKPNADYMARVLKPHGWQYVVVDIQWSEPNPKAHGYRPDAVLTMDSYGRLIPAPNRFPSSAGGAGFRPLADYLHGLGLKFGIHIMRGIPRQAVRTNTPILNSTARAADVADQSSTCRWNTDMYGVNMSKPGAQAYVDSIVNLYASWGVDYIKADDEARPLHQEEIAALHRAISSSGREIVLSLSPGPAPLEHADFLAANAQLWRVSNDLWDRWKDVRAAFDYLASWSKYATPGHWPDADMLPLGHIGLRAERGDDRESRLTHDEQQSLLSLWFIARSPLMFGGDLPTSNQWTRDLITNEEALAVNQNGAHPRQVFQHGDQIGWVSDGQQQGHKYVALFNVGESGPASINIDPKTFGFTGSFQVRDLWNHRDLGALTGERRFEVPSHGSVLLELVSSR